MAPFSRGWPRFLISKVRAVCGSAARTDPRRTDPGGVVSRTCSQERDAVSEMKEGPSEPAYRSRLQTTVSCCCPMAMVVNVTEKAQRRLRHVWVRETNANEPLMRPRNRSTDDIKTGAPPLSRKECGGNLITGHAVSGVQVA